MSNVNQQLEQIAASLEDSDSKLSSIVNGGITTVVQTGSGPQPSYAKWRHDNEAFFEQAAQKAETEANRAKTEADRANTFADNSAYVTQQRLTEQSTLDLNFSRGKYLVDDGSLLETSAALDVLSVVRSTPKWVFGPNGLLREVAPNTLARAWNPETGEPLGALIEPSATNNLTFSGFQNGVSDAPARGGLISAVTTGWNGELPQNGIAFGHDGVTNSYAYKAYNLEDGVSYTFSVFVEMDDGLPPVFNSGQTVTNDFVFAMESAVIQPTSAEYVGGGVYRLSVTKTAAATTGANVGVVKYFNNTNRTFKVSGYQLEQGAVATSYIPTNGAPVTRAADDVSRTLGGEFNAEQGTVLVSFDTPINYTGYKFAATLGDSNLDRVSIGLLPGTVAFSQVRGSSDMTKVEVNVTPGSKVFGAVSYNNVTGDCAFAVNGVSNVGVNTFTTNNPRLLIGSQISSDKLSSIVNYCKYIPRALSAAELEELTAI